MCATEQIFIRQFNKTASYQSFVLEESKYDLHVPHHLNLALHKYIIPFLQCSMNNLLSTLEWCMVERQCHLLVLFQIFHYSVI